MIVEVEAFNFGVRRQGIDALLASGTKQLQGGHHVHLRVIEFGNRRRIHHIAIVDLHRIGIGGGDVAETGDIFVQFDLHDAVLFQRMHGAGFLLARLNKAQRLGNRHLKNQDLIFFQRGFRNTVTRLNQRGIHRAFRGGRAAHSLEETTDGDGVGRIVRALVDDFQNVFVANDAGGDLNPAGAPAVRHRHFASGKGHLIAGNRHRF
ncbi:carbon-phosphorus lyase complex subunit [Pantoea ananatis AJ13355]|uniref:Carbon-phosphorus lyase complex subunit n=1 Tax=Pantoea ananatis (strain AJ13355) TaxID=932677 RepID=A0A0H3L4L7_PANAA|nr:carbon-phosphorus lyase complex subunit [Pantoea ananatis AJ13355]